MLKKMTLLAGMALAAIAFAAPASASALEWTHNGEEFEGTLEDTLNGTLWIGNMMPGGNNFGCQIQVNLQVTGGSSSATISSFSPKTKTCQGSGWYVNCEIAEDNITLPVNMTVDIVGTNQVTISAPAEEPLVIDYVLNSTCSVEQTTATVTDLTLTGTNSYITALTVGGVGFFHTKFRGIGEITHNMAMAGSLGSESTITIS